MTQSSVPTSSHENASSNRSLRSHLATLIWFGKLLWRASPAGLGTDAGAMIPAALLPAVRLLILERLLDSVNTVIGQGEAGFRQILIWILLLAGLQLLLAGINAVRARARAIVREKTGWRLQELVIQKAADVALHHYEQPVFFDRQQRALWASIWRSFSVFHSALLSIELTITLLSYLGLLVTGHLSLPFVLIIGAYPILLSHLRRGKETYHLHRRQTADKRHTDYYIQLLTDRDAAKEIRLYHLGDYLTRAWKELAESLRSERLRLTMHQQKHLGYASLTTIVTFFAALLILLWQAVAGLITFGAFFALANAVNRFQEQLSTLLRTISSVFEEMLYITDLQDFVATPEERQPQMVSIPDRPFKIVCEDLCFAYPDGPTVLDKLNVTIDANEKIALVGENGSGKTTLIKLLLGLYPPTSGRILIGGIDITTIDPEAMRSKCAAVFQDFLQYQRSAAENVGYGRVEAMVDVPRIQAAAIASGASEFIDHLPDRYETTLGRYFTGGQDLSRGQWQKLALSRAYFREAQFLIFDEPTAALDPRAEVEVFKQFRALAEGKSAIFVSHRMASARVADRIMVLKGGHLVEHGTHDELLNLAGEYARMFTLQAKWYRSEDF